MGGHIPDLGYLIPVFVTLHVLGGHIGLPIIVLTFFCSKNVSRHPTLTNFCISWVIYSVSYCLLIFSGQKHDQPPSRVCIAQAAMVHGAPTMASVAGLLVVIQIWSTFNDPQQTLAGVDKWPSARRQILVLALPYVVFFAFTLAAGLIALKHPESVSASNGLYCTVIRDPFRRFAVPSFCALMLVLVVIFEFAIIIRSYRSWKRIARIFPLADRKASRSIFIRVGIFNVFSIISLSASVFFLSDDLNPWPFMVQASIPLVAVLIFGTQKDLFLAWSFWKEKPKTPSSDDSVQPRHSIRTSHRNSFPFLPTTISPSVSRECLT